MGEIVREILKLVNRKWRDFGPTEDSFKLVLMIIKGTLVLLSTVFDQLSSPNRPQYALYAFLLACVVMVFCIVEAVWSAYMAKVYWRKGKSWFYHPSGHGVQPYFGTLEDNMFLFCALCQFIATAVYYAYTIKPIQISVWPFAYPIGAVSCKIVRKLLKNDSGPRPLV